MDATTPTATTELGHGLDVVVKSFLATVDAVDLGLPGGHRGYKILRFVEGSTCQSQIRIAAALGVDRTVMTYLIDELEQAGLVTRRPDPQDRRARLIDLTDAGRDRLATARERMAQVERHVLAGLDEGEVDQLRTLLGKIVAHHPDDGPGPLCSISG
ncbi:MAG: MarR family transcriptional regulator [Aeromicrobium erythreum]